MTENPDPDEWFGKQAQIESISNSALSKTRISAFLNSESDVVVFYTHAVADGKDRWEDPYIVITNPETGEDEQLTATEIFRMHIPSKLVILTTCSSGYGEARYGEGLMSLARSFIAAGAQCVLCPLWEVWEDRAHEFVSYFTQQLVQNKYTFEEGLLATRKKFSKRQSQLEWGAFCLIGNSTLKLLD